MHARLDPRRRRRRSVHPRHERRRGRTGGLSRARRGQRVLHRLPHGLVHFAPVAKADLDLGRVHVDVDARRVDAQVERIHRLALAVQHVLVGRAHGVRQHLVAHEAAVHIEELLVATGARRVRNARAPLHGHHPQGVVDGDAAGHEVVAQRVRQTRFSCLPRAPLLDQPAVVPHGKAHVGPRQRMAPHRFHAVREFGGVGLQELAPGRGGVEEFTHLDRAAVRASDLAQFAGTPVEREGGVGAAFTRVQREFGDRVDGRQRLAAESHRADGFEVAQAGDLAGRVAAQGCGQVATRNAFAVVLHRDQAHAAARQPHRDRSTTSPAAIWLISSSGSSRMGRRSRVWFEGGVGKVTKSF
jgi:hypothetical protein